MRLQEHIVASVVVSAGVYAATRSKAMTIVSFLTGIFLDIDHVSDYWIEYPFSFDLPHFFETYEVCNVKKNYIWFHCIELLLPLTLISYFTRSAIVIGISMGFAQHMLFDSIFNHIYPTSYFLYYRWSKGFVSEHIFNHKYQCRESEIP